MFPPFPNRWPITGQLFFSSYFLLLQSFRSVTIDEWMKKEKKEFRKLTIIYRVFPLFPFTTSPSFPSATHRTATQGLIKVGLCWQPYDYIIHSLRRRCGSCPHCSYRLRSSGMISDIQAFEALNLEKFLRSTIYYRLRTLLYRVYPDRSI